MPTSELDICNKALLRVGHTKFLDAFRGAGDGSLEADVCNRSYDDCRDEVLLAAPWPFAVKRWLPAQIAPAVLANGVVPTGWAYAYTMPPDLVAMRPMVPVVLPASFSLVPPNLIAPLYQSTRVTREDQTVPFTIEYDSKLQANILLTDAPTPEWRYTAQITDPTRFDAAFVSALAWRLAVELALAVRKDVKMAGLAQQMYDRAVAEAAAKAKREVRPDNEPGPAYIATRGG